MQHYKTTLERAFEMARNGESRSMRELSRHLQREGYDLVHLKGPVLMRQLRTLLREAHAIRDEASP